MHIDEDNGFPSPGFRLGLPVVQRKVFDAQTAKNAFLLITPAGARVGDVRLGEQSFSLGAYFRRRPDKLKKVGEIIKSAICRGEEVPK